MRNAWINLERGKENDAKLTLLKKRRKTNLSTISVLRSREDWDRTTIHGDVSLSYGYNIGSGLGLGLASGLGSGLGLGLGSG